MNSDIGKVSGVVMLLVVPVYAFAGQTLQGDYSSSAMSTPAISVIAGDTVNYSNGRATTSGASSAAVFSLGTVLIDNATLVTTNLNSSGLVVSGAVGSGQLSNSTVSTSGSQSYGVGVLAGAKVDVSNSSINSRVATGVYVSGPLSSATLNKARISSGDSGILLLGIPGSQASVSITDSDISTTESGGHALNINRDAAAQVTNSRFITQNDGAYAVWLASPTSSLVAKDLVAITSGDGALGIVAQGGQVSLVGGSIDTTGQSAHGVYAEGAGTVINTSNTLISVHNSQGSAATGGAGAVAFGGAQINLDGGSVTTSNGAMGLYSATGSTVTANKLAVTSDGDRAQGLVLNSGGAIDAHAVVVKADGAGSVALGAYAGAVGQQNQAQIDAGSSLSAAQGSVIAVRGGQLDLALDTVTATGKSLLDVDQGKLSDGTPVDYGTVSIRALNSTLAGDSLVSGKSAGSVSMQLDNTALTGRIQGLSSLNMQNASTWNLTGDSQLGNFTAKDSRVNFAAAGGFKTLNITGDLSGNTTFAMNTDLASQRGDLITVGGTTTGEHTLVVADSGNNPASQDGTLTLVKTQGGSGKFDLYGGHVDAGAFRYQLLEQNNNWYLASSQLVNPPVTPPIVPPKVTPQDLSKGSNSALGMQTASSLLLNAELDNLNSRLGDLRTSNDNGGVWVRGFDRRYNVNTHYSRDFDQSIQGLQVGVDKAIQLDAAKLYVGGLFGSGSADMSFGEGAHGTIDSTSIGGYATWLQDGGWYVDGVLKYNRLDSDVRGTTNLGQRVKGHDNVNGYSASVEGGKRFKADSGWFVEPQVQLNASHVDGLNYTSTDGLKVDSGAVDSLQGRVGAMVGKNFALTGGRSVEPYAKVSLIHEFNGRTEVNVNGVHLNNALPDGSRAEFVLGSNLRLSASQAIYVEGQYADGKQLQQPWGINLGYRLQY